MLGCALGRQWEESRHCGASLYDIQYHAVDTASIAHVLVCECASSYFVHGVGSLSKFPRVASEFQLRRCTNTIPPVRRSYFIARILIRQIQNRGKVEGDVREDDDDDGTACVWPSDTKGARLGCY